MQTSAVRVPNGTSHPSATVISTVFLESATTNSGVTDSSASSFSSIPNTNTTQSSSHTTEEVVIEDSNEGSGRKKVERKNSKKFHFKNPFHHHHHQKDHSTEITPSSSSSASSVLDNADLTDESEVRSIESTSDYTAFMENDFVNKESGEITDLDALMPPTIVRPSGAIRIVPKKVAIVYNPKSGAQKGEKLAKKTERILKDNGIEVEMVVTERRGHGEELAREMPLDGVDILCFLGGDGTFHECLNGFMRRKDDAIDRVALAVLPGGTGNSFALELQGNNQMDTSIRSVLRGITTRIDLAHMYFPTTDETIYSFNSVHWGMGTNINITAERLRWMGKAIRYSTAAALELMRGSTREALVEMVDKDGKFFEVKGQFSLMIANNIMSTLKGMKMVPNARINDGLMDLLLIKSGKTTDLVSVFKRVYNGTHTELDCVDYYQVKSFSVIPFESQEDSALGVDPEVAEELLDIDGELKGKTPFKCTMMPKAVRVVV